MTRIVIDKTTKIGRTLGLVGLAIASINLAKNIPDDKNFDLYSSVQTLSDVVGLGKAGVALLNNDTLWVKTMSQTLQKAGKVVSAAGLALDVKDTISALKDREWGEAALGGMGIAGGLLSLFGFGAAGSVVGFAAIAISFQMSRVEASNVLENKHTEAFLIELGIPQETAYHLRNADSEGRSIGPVLIGLMEHTGTSRSAMLDSLISLNATQALELAEACHGVDPDGKGNFPIEDDYAQYAGRSKEDLMEDKSINYKFGSPAEQDADRPHSLEGLKNYIQRRNLPIALG